MKRETIIKAALIIVVLVVTVTFVVAMCLDSEVEYIDVDRENSASNSYVFQTEADSQTVYLTEKGSKYHLSGCTFLKSNVKEITLSNAKEQGYEPCSKCFDNN